MKKIENRKTSIIETVGQPETISYADIMLMVINKSVPEGYPPSKMRKDFRVIDVLDKAIKDKSEFIELEDGDFDHWWSRYGDDFAFGMQHRDLLAFDDYLKEIKSGKQAET